MSEGEGAALVSLLPHRHPMLMVDAVATTNLVLKTIHAVKNIDPNDPILAGHFPGNPIYPGVLTIESLAQAAGILLSLDPQKKYSHFVLAGVKSMRFRRPMLPGDTVDLHAHLVRHKMALYVFSVQALVNGDVAAAGQIQLAGEQ